MILPTAIAFGVGFVGSHISRDHLTINQTTVVSEKKWMAGTKKAIKHRGTEGICTGKNKGRKGGPCPVGSQQYTLAQTFKKSAEKGGKSK